MLIKIDVNKLIKHQLTIQRYLLGYLIYANKRDSLLEYSIETDGFNTYDYEVLIDRGYLFPTDVDILDTSTLIVTEEFIALVKEMETGEPLVLGAVIQQRSSIKEMFNNWYENYPKMRLDSKKPLRTSRKDCEIMFVKIINKNPEIYNDIILATEIHKEREALKNFEYMRTTYKFLERETWRDYKEQIEERRSNQKTPNTTEGFSLFSDLYNTDL